MNPQREDMIGTSRIEHRLLPDLAATEALGTAIAERMTSRPGGIVFLHGPLGAGKTSLARGLLRACGVEGAVRSPTFTLMEVYELEDISVLHLDLYRLTSADELWGLGLDDYPPDTWWWLVEWPERGVQTLPSPWLDVRLAMSAAGRQAWLQWAADAPGDGQSR